VFFGDKPLSKSQYVVMNEHTLGYIQPQLPKLMGVLHGSVLRGSPHDWRNGPVWLADSAKLRPATRQDFADYCVQLPPDF